MALFVKMSILIESLLPPDRESFEERAAMLEYDAGMTREKAEEAAMEMLIAKMGVK